MKKTGILIIMLGLILTIFTAITFFTRERVAKIGDLKIIVNKPHHLNWSPMTGILVMGIGGVVVLLSRNKK